MGTSARTGDICEAVADDNDLTAMRKGGHAWTVRISDGPIVNDWVRVWSPYTPGAPSTPFRFPVKLTWVFAGQ